MPDIKFNSAAKHSFWDDEEKYHIDEIQYKYTGNLNYTVNDFSIQVSIHSESDSKNYGVTRRKTPNGGFFIVSISLDKNKKYKYTISIKNNSSKKKAYRDIVIEHAKTKCFLAGSVVKTDQGGVPIENLSENYTIDNKPIIKVTKYTFRDDKIVLIKKDALGVNKPDKDTYVTGGHKILYENKLTPAYKLFFLLDNITFYKANGKLVYNVLMKKHDIMTVNNLICETLSPPKKDNFFTIIIKYLLFYLNYMINILIIYLNNLLYFKKVR